MIKLLSGAAVSTLALLVLTSPSSAEDASQQTAPSRTPWTKADPSSEKVVRWVVEGCAAYPVTVETATDALTLSASSETALESPPQK